MRLLVPGTMVLVVMTLGWYVVGNMLDGARTLPERRLSECAARWAPREVEFVSFACRVKIDGEWWPEDAVRVSP